MQSRRGAAASGAPFLFAATRPPPPAPACASRAVRFSPKIARHHPESTRITVGRRFASWLRTAARRARRLVSRPPRGAARGRHGGRGRGQGRTLLVRRRVTERDVALRMRVRVDDDATRMSCAAPGRRLWHVLLEGRSPGWQPREGELLACCLGSNANDCCFARANNTQSFLS